MSRLVIVANRVPDPRERGATAGGGVERGQDRLAIKISDNVSGKFLTRDVNFPVKAS